MSVRLGPPSSAWNPDESCIKQSMKPGSFMGCLMKPLRHQKSLLEARPPALCGSRHSLVRASAGPQATPREPGAWPECSLSLWPLTVGPSYQAWPGALRVRGVSRALLPRPDTTERHSNRVSNIVADRKSVV